jgi:hypothetical protein
MKIEFRLIKAVIATALISAAIAKAAPSGPLDETPLSRCSTAPLNATKFMKSESR